MHAFSRCCSPKPTSPTSETRELAEETYGRQISDVIVWLDQGIASGAVRADINPAAEAARFIAKLIGMTHLWLIIPGDIDFDTVRESAKEQLRRQLTPTNARS